MEANRAHVQIAPARKIWAAVVFTMSPRKVSVSA
jgi:hypothetical protein